MDKEEISNKIKEWSEAKENRQNQAKRENIDAGFRDTLADPEAKEDVMRQMAEYYFRFVAGRIALLDEFLKDAEYAMDVFRDSSVFNDYMNDVFELNADSIDGIKKILKARYQFLSVVDKNRILSFPVFLLHKEFPAYNMLP